MLIERQGRQVGHGLKADIARTAGDRTGILQTGNHRTDKGFKVESIGDKPHLTPTPYTGQHQLLGQRGAELILGQQPHRQLIPILLLAAGDFDFGQQQRMPRLTEACAVDNPDLFDRHVLLPEPASVGQPCGERHLLQGGARRRVEQLFEACLEHQGHQFRQAVRRLGMPARHLAFTGQQEPVKAIGRQGQHEMQLADGREGIPAQHFNRNATGKFREVQLDGLGTA